MRFGKIHTQLVDHIENKCVIDGDNTLHVIGVVSNPARWHSRFRIAREWITHMKDIPNISLTIVEAAFGSRHHELHGTGYDHIKVRTNSETWIKESMIDLAYRHISVKYPDAKYFAWIDADVFFKDIHWAQETIQQLQHFEVVQPWRDCCDLDSHGGIIQHFKSFGYQHQRGVKKQMHPSQPYEYSHSGFAWACTRKFAEGMFGAGGANGPLMDWAVLGSADHHMAFAMIGEVKNTIHGGMSPAFFRKCHEWQDRAVRITQKDVGYVHGRIEHLWHGNKTRRYYRERWQILVDCKYNPDTDIIHDEQGLCIVVNNNRLEVEIRKYNRSRMEDSLD